MVNIKRYLNIAEKEAITFLSTLNGYLSKQTLLYDNELVTLKERKFLKTACTYVDKVLQALYARLNKDMLIETYKYMNSTEMAMIPKQEFLKRNKEIKDVIKYCEVEVECLQTLAELAVEKCKECKINNYKACQFRTTFLKLEIPVFDTEAQGKCPYKMEG